VASWNRAAERCFGYRGPRSSARTPSACELLGIDSLNVANEGKFIAVIAPDEADAALAALGAHPLGRDAVKIGDIREEPPGVVARLTPIGGTQIVDMLVGDPLPRIC
jgi:hydrogenase expression/formation protein HypE